MAICSEWPPQTTRFVNGNFAAVNSPVGITPANFPRASIVMKTYYQAIKWQQEGNKVQQFYL